MQNLKQLNLSKQEIAAAQAKRKAFSEKQLQQGLSWFQTARQEGFKQVESLKKSCGYFISALKTNRKDTQAYYLLAYLFCLLKDFKTAESYLLTALKYHPNHAGLQAFLTQITQIKRSDISKKRQYQRSEAVIEKRLDAFEMALDEMCGQLSQFEKMIPPHPTGLKEELEALQEHYFSRYKTLQTLNVECQMLQEDLDMNAYAQQLLSLEQRLQPYKKALADSLKLSQCHAQIKSELQEVSLFTQDLKGPFSQSLKKKERLEQLMDRCDYIADQLDALSEEKIDISQTEQIYHQLIGRLEHLQDLLDDDF